MYFVIEIFTEQFPLDDKIIKDKEKIQVVMDNINIIYKQIKKNEHSPNTEYLYNNLNSSNLQQSIAKLEQMNAITEEFIPRLEKII
jgi:3-methyladenine DNA glycosylase Tag